MADFGEYLPRDAVFYDGRRGDELHNLYSVLWAQVNREAVEESGKLGQVYFFMRAGAAGKNFNREHPETVNSEHLYNNINVKYTMAQLCLF